MTNGPCYWVRMPRESPRNYSGSQIVKEGAHDWEFGQNHHPEHPINYQPSFRTHRSQCALVLEEISLPVTILASTSQGTSEISCTYFKVLEHFEAKLGKNAVMP
ncbi:hypothetical protein B0H13DRAFT_1873134 [Mycena leptocephala]|nr:hypothetical protein B0H13DRAFT_1873134 [Mycena leptocephala]